METVFKFYSKSADKEPGKGVGESLNNKDNYDKLSKIRDWRKILSNFYECNIKYDGYMFKSAEHAFHYAKFKEIGQLNIAKKFTLENNGIFSPIDAKKLGGKNGLYAMNVLDQNKWAKVRNIKMKEILENKFKDCKEAKEVLLLTKNAQLWHFLGRGGGFERWDFLEDIRNEILNKKDLELTMEPNSNFKTFIQGLLEQADIGADFRQLITQPEPLKIFQRAFVHNTYDSVNNYEVLEYVGDGIVKAINSQYVPKRFGNILNDEQFQSKSGTKEGLLSKIRRHLEQSSFLYPIALKLGFWDHVKADVETKTTNRNKVLEDVMEAYIGALTTVIDKYITDGFGYMFAKKFLENQLDQLDIVITPEILDDPITRLNELYKASVLKNNLPGLKWGDAKYIEETLILPRVSNIDNKRHAVGYAVFNESDNLVYITDSKNWYTQNNIPINLRPVGLPLDLRVMSDDDKKRYQAIHWMGVLGYPPNQGQSQIREKQLIKTKIERLKENVSNLLKQNLEEDEQSLKNIGIYINNLTKEINNLKGKDAQIIGQGIAFVKKDAKKKAAKEALEVLKQAGYEK